MREETGLLEGVQEVLTPEYVEFRYPLAGLYSRFLAWLIDAVIIVLGFAVVMTVLGNVMIGFPGFASALGFVVYFLLDWGYAMVLETWWSGQTVGKRVLGIRTLQESGVRLGFIQAALRNLARAVDRLPFLYLVGAVTALLSSSQQRLGDLLAGTIVVRDRRQKLPAGLTRAPEEAQLLADPAFTSRLAQLGAEEQEVVLSAALRREELAMDARLKLFHALAEHLEARGFYRPPHLSGEKLVLLVASGLAQRGRTAAPPRRRPIPRTPGDAEETPWRGR